MKTISLETKLARAVWVKAHMQARMGQGPVVLRFPDPGSRERMRLKLYNAVKPIRNGKEAGTPELREAVANVQITSRTEGTGEGGESFVLTLQTYAQAEELLGLAAMAGIDLAELAREDEVVPGAGIFGLIQGGTDASDS